MTSGGAADSAPEPDEDGTDGGTGDPNDDRAFLMHQPPAQVREDATQDDDAAPNALGDAST